MELKTISLAFTTYEANWWLASTFASPVYLLHNEWSKHNDSHITKSLYPFFVFLIWAGQSERSKSCGDHSWMVLSDSGALALAFLPVCLETSSLPEKYQQACGQHYKFWGWEKRWKVHSNTDLIERQVYIPIPPASRSSKWLRYWLYWAQIVFWWAL